MCVANENTNMTSPVISKPEEKSQNGKSEEKQQKDGKKSPTHSANGIKRAPSRTEGAVDTPEQPDPFSWFRVFKLADLMIKQGC